MSPRRGTVPLGGSRGGDTVPLGGSRGGDTATVLAFRPRSPAAPFPRRLEAPLRRRGEGVRFLRRHPLLRIGRSFATALLIVGTPVALVVWVGHSPVFALRELKIESDGGRLARAWAEAALQPYVGENLPRLPLAYVDRALAAHPWVESVDVHKILPGRLAVQVVEKRAVALLRRGDEILYLDEEGEVITPFDAASETVLDGVDLLLVKAGGEVASRRALEIVREIEDASPSWAAGLSEIEILGPDDFRLWSAGLPFPLLVRSGTLAAKTSYLEALLPQVARRYARVEAVDLRFARRIIVQPSARRSGPGVFRRGMDG